MIYTASMLTKKQFPKCTRYCNFYKLSGRLNILECKSVCGSIAEQKGLTEEAIIRFVNKRESVVI